MSQKMKTLVIWIALIAIFVGSYQLFRPADSSRLSMESADLFRSDLAGGEIAAVRVKGDSLEVTLFDGTMYETPVRYDAPLGKDLADHGVRISAGPPPKSSFPWSSILAAAIPIVLLIVLFVLIMKRIGGQNILSLRKTTARLAPTPTTRFSDVGGSDEAKQQLQDIVDFLKRPKTWERSGARLPSGILLEGPPGSGKTLLARAVAGEAGVPFFEVSASEFVEMFVGVGSARVRDLFEQASKKTPSVIFIDELDAIGRRRGSGAMNLGYQEREQTLNQLLVNLDGFQKRKGVVVIAATNRADVLDPALLRAGRFDLHLKVPPLSETARAEVLRIHLAGKPAGQTVDVAKLAKETHHYSGADLEQLVNAAALEAVRRSGRNGQQQATIEREDFETALRAQAHRYGGFDQLDKLLIESSSQLGRPDVLVIVRATLDDGAKVSGEVVWVDQHFIKLKGADSEAFVISRRNIVRIEALSGTEPARLEDIRPDAWAKVLPDSA
jgi:cell division protease FtsH